MSHHFIALRAAAAPGTTIRVTAPIAHDTDTLIATRWYYADSKFSFFYSAWFHPDTSTPTLQDPGNLILTPETPFAIKEHTPLLELLPQCKAIPQTHRNITLQLRNTDAAENMNALVGYHFQ